MSDPNLEHRLARLEAMQTDQVHRLGRLEALTASTSSGATPREEPASGKWQKVGLIALAVIALVWLLDELPGPAIWDRLF